MLPASPGSATKRIPAGLMSSEAQGVAIRCRALFSVDAHTGSQPARLRSRNNLRRGTGRHVAGQGRGRFPNPTSRCQEGHAQVDRGGATN